MAPWMCHGPAAGDTEEAAGTEVGRARRTLPQQLDDITKGCNGKDGGGGEWREEKSVRKKKSVTERQQECALSPRCLKVY